MDPFGLGRQTLRNSSKGRVNLCPKGTC